MTRADAADLAYLERAAVLARHGWGGAHPNPLVGCVIVRGGEVVGEGFHAEWGGPHAEVVALEAAGPEARGATAYVTLEPCNHHGKTPPCSGALVEAGVQRVVFGAADPGEAAGGGAERLRAQGIEVVGPCWDRVRARRDNPAFFHAHEDPATPYVALKMAMSLDGRIAAGPGRRTQLTGPAAGKEVHRLRAGFDAVMIGAETALVDDPLLTVREPVRCRAAPTRVVLDSRARLPLGSALVGSIDQAPLLVLVADEAPEDRVSALRDAGVAVTRAPGSACGLDLPSALRACKESGLSAVLCEGGARLATSLVSEGLVGRFHLFIAPLLLGPDGVPLFHEAPGNAAAGWELAGPPRALDPDVHLVYDRRRSASAPTSPSPGDI